MFDARIDSPDRAMCRYALTRHGEPLARRDVLTLWQGANDAFRRFFAELLRAAPFNCYRFETPPVTRRTMGEGFELVLIDSPAIDLAPDSTDFQSKFDDDPSDIVVFDNLGGDAAMIVPRPRLGITGYAHIAGFTRRAPFEQQTALWRVVGDVLHRRLGDAPLWLSTAGGGVPWLHVRLDTRPKYYVFDEYRRFRDG